MPRLLIATFAAATARLAADDATGPLAARLAALETALETGQAAILAAIEARDEMHGALAQLTETLAVVLQRLDAQADVLHGHIAREDMVAGRLSELAELARGPAAFQETLVVTLAEFLARLERRETPARVPQFS